MAAAVSSAPASSSAGPAPPPAQAPLRGADAVEKACGPRYRSEVTDRGLGFGPLEMRRRLRAWGYDASREGCQEWLRLYRMGDGAQEGGAGVWAASRQQLLRWYHVEKLGPQALQDRYRQECGLYADRSHLTRWVSAQVLPRRSVFVAFASLWCDLLR